jgi:predicted TIM-barrel fold metal-dependent hydrolase
MRALGLALVLTARAAASAAAAHPADGLTDHHVHVLSPTLVRDWKSLGVPFTRPDDVYTSAAGLLGPGAEGRLEQALLVPMAHFYGNEEFRGGLGLSLEQEQARVRAENDYVAAEAARYPGRATALCSVDFSRPYAWEELRRCRSELRSPGLKLHLRSAGADIGDAEQLGRLEAMAGWAESEGMGLLLHVDTGRGGLGAGDVERFFDRVLQPHPRLEVVIAHLGGSGGYGQRTRAAFRAFLDRLGRNGDRGPLVRFDLSAVLLERESEGVPATTGEEAAALAADLRRAGFDAMVFGSDYPVFDPRAYARLLAERLELSAAELRRLLANRATFVRSSP